MGKGATVWLTGAHVSETAHALLLRLRELGSNAECIDESHAARLGGATAAAHACHELCSQGVIVVAAYGGVRPEGECLEVEIPAHDTPDFAAEKVLDELAEAGVLDLEHTDYSPEEEERIKHRLADLGYIE